jgi:hypothetical protein
VHPGRLEVRREAITEVVGRHRADESRVSPKGGDTDRGVRGRPAGDLPTLADDRPDPLARRPVDERHRAKRQPE